MTFDIPTGIDAAVLSAAARSVWAKSAPFTGDQTHWLPLHRHLDDTAGIAALLWDEWLSPHIVELLAEAVGSPDSARALAIWLASIHDCGKASPAFSVQVPALTHKMRTEGLTIRATVTADSEERRGARHELVGYLAIRSWLIERYGFTPAQAKKIASVVAAHHGRPPSPAMVEQAQNKPWLVGDGLWAQVREELIDAAADAYADTAHIAEWAVAPLPQHALALLSGFVIVADWVASNDRFFPLADLAQPDVDPNGRVAAAWRTLDMPGSWQPAAPENRRALFAQRFGFDEPTELQTAVMDAAWSVEAPSLLIIEEAMGQGKTEAALAAAEILATRFSLNGVFVGLPTRATADGMFTRLLAWAEHLGLDLPLNTFLAHAKASLNADFAKQQQDWRFQNLGERRPPRRGQHDESSIAHGWFSDSKRGPLADLVIGTIDQALIGGLRSKHVMLRQLALAGKVVILDEAHAFDAYTDTYLENILSWLGAYGVPAVMLSATLPSDKREAFVEAYEKGRRSRAAPARGTRGAAVRRSATSTASERPVHPYPSITVSTPNGPARVIAPRSTQIPTTISLEQHPDDLTTLAQILRERLADGGTAVVIRNTVTRVQETAAYLRAHLDIDIVVAHSRFLAADRARKDRELVELFGKKGSRPERMIVVASQVVEQSLDIDFGLMVSDVAPIDLLLQRSGRLHRHVGRTRPAPLREPTMILTGVDWSAEPPQPVRGSIAVYGRHLLLRTLAVLRGRTVIEVPAEIPELVQRVYSDDPIHPESWAEEARTARIEFDRLQEDKRERAQVFRLDPPRVDGDLIGWLGIDADDSESGMQAAVRDGVETLEVLVIQQKDGIWTTPDWLEGSDAGQQLPDNEPPSAALTRIVLGCAIRLPAALCHPGLIDAQIRELESLYPMQAWHGSHALRGELVLPFDADRRAFLGEFELQYDPHDGLSYRKAPSPAVLTEESEARW